MPLPRKKTVLESLSVKRLMQIACAFDVEVGRQWPKSQLLDKLAASRKAPLAKILKELNIDELRDICRRNRLPHLAVKREILEAAITGRKSMTSRPDQLRPFFGYYGGKWRDAPKHYPPPLHDAIVEPFAGSAGYSLRYPEKQVFLVEKDPILFGVWEYLLSAKSEDILNIPDVLPEQSIDDLDIQQEAKWLVGFWLNRGVEAPRKRPSKWMRDGIRPGSFWGERVKSTIANQLGRIRHWRVFKGDFDSDFEGLPKTATWFIDPPYQHAGHHYRYGSKNINYQQLGKWCLSRRGQVIVCENEAADWLPDFQLLNDIKTTRRRRCREVVSIRTNDK